MTLNGMNWESIPLESVVESVWIWGVRWMPREIDWGVTRSQTKWCRLLGRGCTEKPKQCWNQRNIKIYSFQKQLNCISQIKRIDLTFAASKGVLRIKGNGSRLAWITFISSYQQLTCTHTCVWITWTIETAEWVTSTRLTSVEKQKWKKSYDHIFFIQYWITKL